MTSDNPAAKSLNPWTHNVIHGLIATGFYSLGGGLYWMTVMPNFIQEVGGSTTAVGIAEGLQGMVNMVSAFPAGYLADKWSRKACIRLGAILQLFGSFALIGAVLLAKQGSVHAYVLCCVALSFQGVCDGIMNGPLLALMDDSCPAGRRSDVETANSLVQNICQSLGPIVGLVMFELKGNTWSLDAMRLVIAVGACIAMLAIIPVWRMDDRWSLGEVSEAVHLQDQLQQQGEGGGGEARELVMRSRRTTCFGLLSVRHVRSVLFGGEIIMALGAGMTVKFFPIFFEDDVKIDPATFNAASASLFGLTAMCTLLANKLAKRIGRLQTVMAGFMIGVCCTFSLGVTQSVYSMHWLMLTIFITRCVSQWSTGAQFGSVIADYTPKATRGRWKALTSICAASWSGSAAFGGWMINALGFGPTFVITALMQASVIPIWALLLPLIAKESEILAASTPSGAADSLETALEPHRQDQMSNISMQGIQCDDPAARAEG
eukprot:TRINITY_DN6380_c1_g1_i1.p1 TRINITY_DN6380_c1_g1~~TRINITY_DN6380_c1_g1_i1.p1  ORF type:complete len:490 (+),score=48.32 TRINITY_DN6380_c1_g1_i1:138-1607(+)